MLQPADRVVGLLLAVAILLITGGTTAFAQHVGYDRPQMTDLHVPPVSYRLQMHAYPDSNLVTGRLEISYRNESADTLDEVWLGCSLPLSIRTRLDSQRPEPDSVDAPWLADLFADERSYCLIDSLLFQGVPLTADQTEISDATMRIKMPVKIKPGEVAFFMGTIRTRTWDGPTDLGLVSFKSWFPKVIEFGSDTVWINGRPELRPMGPLLGRFSIVMAVDSSWDMIAPGELINEKEIYGLLPPTIEDSTYVDIVNKHQLSYMGRRYTPEFEDGLKRFYLRLENEYYFPLIFGPEFIRDRAGVGGVTVDVCYPPERAEVWAGHGIDAVKDFLRRYERNFGPSPHSALKFVVTDNLLFWPNCGSLFELDPDTTFLTEILLRTITRSYVTQAYGPFYDVISREPWDLMQFMQITVAPDFPYLEENRYNDINILARYEKQLGHEVIVGLVRDFLAAHRYDPIQYDDLVNALKKAAGELNADSPGSSDKETRK